MISEIKSQIQIEEVLDHCTSKLKNSRGGYEEMPTITDFLMQHVDTIK